jgi:flagellar protein FliS
MWQRPHDAYLEGRIESADPIELVGLLYHACTASVREARRYLAEGEIEARSRSISRAFEILVELSGALDHERGGEISGRLAQLYDYMERQLLAANLQQSDEALAEVLGLLATLGEAWDGVRAQTRPPEIAASPWGQPVPQEPAESAHAWSL